MDCNCTYNRNTDKIKIGNNCSVRRNNILNELRKLQDEPDYQHEGEDWRIGLFMAEDIIMKYLF